MGPLKQLKIYLWITIGGFIAIALLILTTYVFVPSLKPFLFIENNVWSKSIDIFLNILYGVFGSALFAYFVGRLLYSTERKQSVISYAKKLQDLGDLCEQSCLNESYLLIPYYIGKLENLSLEGDFLYFNKLKHNDFDFYDALNASKKRLEDIKLDSTNIIENLKSQEPHRTRREQSTDQILNQLMEMKKQRQDTYRLDDWHLYDEIEEAKNKIESLEIMIRNKKNELQQHSNALKQLAQQIQKNAEHAARIHSV